jgi:hypothetical protein
MRQGIQQQATRRLLSPPLKGQQYMSHDILPIDIFLSAMIIIYNICILGVWCVCFILSFAASLALAFLAAAGLQ